jgi:hypothetical protein
MLKQQGYTNAPTQETRPVCGPYMPASFLPCHLRSTMLHDYLNLPFLKSRYEVWSINCRAFFLLAKIHLSSKTKKIRLLIENPRFAR